MFDLILLPKVLKCYFNIFMLQDINYRNMLLTEAIIMITTLGYGTFQMWLLTDWLNSG